VKRVAATVDEFLATVSHEQRRALSKLRATIRATVPGAEECITYGIPGYRLHGRFFVGFGVAGEKCSFYPGGAPVGVHHDELKAYDLSKGTIRFPATSPLPASLVRRIVKARLAEYAARSSTKSKTPRKTARARRAETKRKKPA
jgi:uncharacterized protein YdhG (YjbR/CyaY superfamily)